MSFKIAFIEYLSNEMVLEIIDLLNNKDLRSSSLVSRKWNQLTQSILCIKMDKFVRLLFRQNGYTFEDTKKVLAEKNFRIKEYKFIDLLRFCLGEPNQKLLDMNDFFFKQHFQEFQRRAIAQNEGRDACWLQNKAVYRSY